MSTHRTTLERLEDLEWMVETGENAAGAAVRLGITVGAIDKWCRNHGRPDLFRRLHDRDPFARYRPNSYQRRMSRYERQEAS